MYNILCYIIESLHSEELHTSRARFWTGARTDSCDIFEVSIYIYIYMYTYRYIEREIDITIIIYYTYVYIYIHI